MKQQKILLILIVIGLIYIAFVQIKQARLPDTESVEEVPVEVSVSPIQHATMALEIGGTTVYVDPVGGPEAFAGQPPADLVLLTDIHGDHFDVETLAAVTGEGTLIVAPQAAYSELPTELQTKATVMGNGESIKATDAITLQAVPMYNLPESEDAYHVKGRGNGYVIMSGDKRIYIAGDTGPIDEMKALADIDIAFVPMNLPYTMTVSEAAQAVLAFAPAQVYPYHYRGTEGLADVEAFKALVEASNPDIEVVLADWYPAQDEVVSEE